MLPYPSKIRPLSDVYFPWVQNDVGEVYGAERKLNHKVAPPFIVGQHVCGTREDFEVGGTRDAISPPVVYDKNGIPLCCQPAIVGEGGDADSGIADISVTPGTTYADSYELYSALPAPVSLMSFTIPQQEWVGFLSYPGLSGTARLRSPLYPGNTTWTLETFGGFPVCSWITAASWNGHGFHTWTPAGGICSSWFTLDLP